MSPSQVINGTECIVFVIPLNGLVINGTPMYALAATYDLATFDHIISVNVFSGRGYVHIIQKDGAMVIRSSSQYAPQTGYNLLSSLSSVMMEDGMSLPQIKADMGMGNSGRGGLQRQGRQAGARHGLYPSGEFGVVSDGARPGGGGERQVRIADADHPAAVRRHHAGFRHARGVSDADLFPPQA